jgi:hypothetical protein
MNRHLIWLAVLSMGMVACSERPPVDWMYSEFKSLQSACPETGEKINRKSPTVYTWSCPYPEDVNHWLSEFEKIHLMPRGWAKGETQAPHPWYTYCYSSKKVVMRIVKVEAKKTAEDDRLWISLRFPGDECSGISDQAK